MSATTLFANVMVLDSTGAEPFPGHVLVEGERIASVARATRAPRAPAGATVVDGGGHTLMSGLCDAHTHLSWNNAATTAAIGHLTPEAHTLAAADNARTYLDCGYTMCLSAATAKVRLDVAIRDAIERGQIPGPRLLANGLEITTTGGLGDMDDGHVAVADGAEEIRKVVRRMIRVGVDLIKLNLSGEEITRHPAERTFMTDEEVAAATGEARRRGVRVCAHARSAESVRQCLRHGIEIIFHASYIDAEGMDLLEAERERFFVVPALHWLYATVHEASAWGVTPEVAKRMGYARELDVAVAALSEMRRRGIRVLPGGDYGFAWTPHGTYARDLQHFVELLGFSPMEAIVAATREGGVIMGRAHELGQVKPGYLADLILVRGNPLDDVTLLQDRKNILAIMKGGAFHKRVPSPQEAS